MVVRGELAKMKRGKMEMVAVEAVWVAVIVEEAADAEAE